MRVLLPTLCGLAMLGGCAAPDDGARPQPIDSAALRSRDSFGASVQTAAWPQDRWWRGYGDAQLDAMIDEALAHSPDVAAALARVRTARGIVQSSGAATLPQIGASGTAREQKQSYNNGIPAAFVPKGWNSGGDAALDASFDLDLWGRNKARLAAATSDAEAARVDARQAELILATALVSGYADLARLYADQDVLKDMQRARHELAELTRQRAAIGLDGQSPVRQAQSLEASAAYELEANAEQIALRRHALAALMGAGPDRGLALARPSARVLIPTALPADAGIALAGRRPDIVAARMRVEGQGHRIDAARRDFLPNISLSGLIGFTSLGLDKLFDSGSDYGNAGAAISLPIFDGGARRGAYRQARGTYDAAVADYDRTVIEALREVADAVSSRDSAERQIAAAARAATEAEAGYRLAMQRYRGGLATWLDALAAQTTMLSARRVEADARFRRLSLDVALVRALGGGFSDHSPTEDRS